MLDVLSEIYRQRGQAAPDRRGADRSVHTVGYLIEAPDPVTYLCTVSVFDSEPIAGVPATSMDYTDITAVHVLLDPFTGRPVHVLGPAGELPFGEVPFARDTRHVVTGHVIPPTSTGTYREDEAAWDRYSTMTFGGVTDVWQQAADVAANLVPNPLPTSPATGWSASETYAFEADFAPNGYEDSFYSYILGTTPTYIWPVPGGTDAIAVTPAASYDVGCYTYTNYAAETAVGVTWYDAAGTSLSTDMGTTVTMTYYAAGTWEYSGSPYWGWEAEPSGTFTAPAGAAYGRPFCITTGDDPYSAFVNVAVFTMVAA